MPKRTRAGVLAALAVAGLTAGAALNAAPAGAATKAPAPKFLSASELPPHPSSAWTADKVTDGIPEEMQGCLGDALLAYDSRHRTFRTELETSAQQLNVVVGDNAKAKALATRLNKEIRTCALRSDADPEIEAEYRSYGSLPVEEGARVHGVHTRASWGAMDIHLLSVGRDGGTVTVVQWGQMGDFTSAPVKAFKKTTTTAVNKLY
ncbi:MULTISPECIES: hypothetical protein [unclassified Streptomyces]|uniref:hypothetical protein n=1 Tax=unclassified Streptomyces TaxID=2593676 RepID=UPI002366A78E|nr:MULTISPECIES: hypothetical protein [unclassified Streptomyces]MDF3146806.1 hypothetical protein [Streptomyces sp. T21Q-yed]WDF42290.1 hypothetical protein PBV52_38600 [Streptomyces sp. T12]